MKLLKELLLEETKDIPHIQLIELAKHKFIVPLLLEYNKDITLQRYGEKLMTRALRDNELRKSEKPADVVDKIETADPTAHKEYTVWMVRQFINGAKFEDLRTTIKHDIGKYDILKRKKKVPLEQRDINKLDYKQMSAFIRAYEAENGDDDETVDKGQFKVVFKGKDTTVVHLLDGQAAEYFGQGTSWCTRRDGQMFKHYANQGDIYVVIPKYPSPKQERYQLHIHSKQCKDKDDASFKFILLIGKFPELKEYFKTIPEYADLPYIQDGDAVEKHRQREEKRKQEIADFLKALNQ